MTDRSRSPALDVALASAVWLFTELLVVRWTGSELPRLAFFKGLVLIAAFLGGGLGMAAGPRRPGLARAVPPLLALLAVAVPSLGAWPGMMRLRFGGEGEFTWNLSGAATALESATFVVFLLAVFAVNLGLFAGLGARLGVALARSAPLPGYLANLAGSLAGVAAFALVSVTGMGPRGWFLVLALPLGFTLAAGRRALAVAVLVAGLAFGAGALGEPGRWSPYNRISVQSLELRDADDRGYNLSVNRAYFMTMLDLGRAAEGFSRLAAAIRHYELPYRLAAPRRVLVLGAGGGNDVAAAVRAGAERIDAIEIDPAIVELGRDLHPERPYQHPSVTVRVADARSWLARDVGRYDLIVLGLLDSHAALTGLPGVRLDNWVYTLEAMRAARARLSDGGLLVLSFAVPHERPWLGLKLHRLLQAAFDRPPLVLEVDYDASLAFVAGPGLDAPRALRAAAELQALVLDPEELASRAGPGAVDIPTDDWPHLYLRTRGLPGGQALLVALLVLVSLLSTRLLLPATGPLDLQAALLGAGFLLVEIRGIADLGLLFGGSWWTVTAVMAAVLVMAMLSAGWVAKVRPRSPWPAYAGLALALLLSTLIRPGHLLGLPLGIAQLAGAALMALPVLFSGVVFAVGLERSADAPRFLGSNLVGAVVGGFLEYASLALGLRALGFVALLLYGLAALAPSRRRPAPGAVA